MQTTTTLPLQLNPGAATAQRSTAHAASADAGQFSALLSNEMAQAQAPAPAPAPQAPQAPRPPAAKPAQAAQHPQADDSPAPQQAAGAPAAAAPAAGDSAKTADADGKAGAKSDDSDSAQKNTDPASAMLALMASLQHPAAKAGAGAKPGDALDTDGARAKRTAGADAGQLAALRAAQKSTGKEGAAAASKLGADAKDAKDAAQDAGAALGADGKPAAGNGADATALLAGAGLKTEHGKAALDAVQLSLQQARDAAQAVQNQAPAVAALSQATQPAALDVTQAAAATDQLSAPVGTDAWEDQVGQKVVYMVGNEEQTASLTLNPPDLGPLQVVLSVSNDQANVTFSANQQEVRQALEDALPRLREMMSQSGIALGNATVDAGNQGQRQAQQDQATRGGRNYGSAEGAGGASESPAPRVTRVLRGDNGMVDTFA